jgi:hypothetical protein
MNSYYHNLVKHSNIHVKIFSMDQSSEASAFARSGGLIGGQARVPKGLAKLSKKQRSEIAQKGVAARALARRSAAEQITLDDSLPEPQGSRAPADASPSAYAAKIGRLGGLKGGKARAKALSPRKRSAIAKKAARARWGK